MSATVKKKLQRKLKIRGLTFKPGAVDEALSFASRFEGAEDEALDLLLDEFKKSSNFSSHFWGVFSGGM